MGGSVSLDSYVRAAPKAELHVHLEGTILPETLLVLARRNRVALPADTVEGIRRWFVYRDFPHFVEIFVTIISCMRTVEDYELLAYEFGAEMARQNVRHAEATFSPSTHSWLGVPAETWFRGLTRGRERAEREFGVTIRWEFDVVRRVDDATTLFPKADYTVGAAIDGMHDGVVALGLGGNEAAGAPEPFAPYFDRAKAAGLRSSPHAGEHAGPPSIWGALNALGAERISHGVRAIEDPALVAHLAKHGIALAVAPTSNLCLGVYPDLAAHPLRLLHEAGVPLSISSDDPPLFNTTLNDDAALLVDPFGLDVAAIDEILLNGVRHSFLSHVEKQRLETVFRAELDGLKTEHLGQSSRL
jgi:aminodeoxyfutalosine deaminase